jgi:hypothetical protein
MGFDTALVLMEHRTDCQVALQVFERLFHGDELDVVLPQQRGIALGQVGDAANSALRADAPCAASAG